MSVVPSAFCEGCRAFSASPVAREGLKGARGGRRCSGTAEAQAGRSGWLGGRQGEPRRASAFPAAPGCVYVCVLCA